MLLSIVRGRSENRVTMWAEESVPYSQTWLSRRWRPTAGSIYVGVASNVNVDPAAKTAAALPDDRAVTRPASSPSNMLSIFDQNLGPVAFYVR